MPFIAPAFAAVGTMAGASAATAAATGAMIVGTTAAVAGTAYSAYSSYKAGKSQQALNNFNAAASDQTALDTARDGRILANEQRRQNRKMQAMQRTRYAASGVVLGAGTPLLVMAEQAGEMELNALQVERDANAKAAQLRQQGMLDRMAGKSARSAGNMNAVATILQGTAQVAGMYSNFNLSRYRGV